MPADRATLLRQRADRLEAAAEERAEAILARAHQQAERLRQHAERLEQAERRRRAAQALRILAHEEQQAARHQREAERLERAIQALERQLAAITGFDPRQAADLPPEQLRERLALQASRPALEAEITQLRTEAQQAWQRAEEARRDAAEHAVLAKRLRDLARQDPLGERDPQLVRVGVCAIQLMDGLEAARAAQAALAQAVTPLQREEASRRRDHAALWVSEQKVRIRAALRGEAAPALLPQPQPAVVSFPLLRIWRVN